MSLRSSGHLKFSYQPPTLTCADRIGFPEKNVISETNRKKRRIPDEKAARDESVTANFIKVMKSYESLLLSRGSELEPRV